MAPPTTILSPEREAYLRRAWPDQRTTAYAIGQHLGLPSATVYRIAQRIGLGEKPRRGLWAAAHEQRLQELYAEGQSASLIAKALNSEFKTAYSRNAVIGKTLRLGLPKRGPAAVKITNRINGQAAHRRLKPKAAPKPRQNNLAAVNIERRRLAGDLPAEPCAPAPFDAALAKPWTERRFGECAYPVAGEGADTFSCCSPCGEATYCAFHAARMFKPPEKVGKDYERSLRRWAA